MNPETTYIGLLRHGETEGGARYRGITDDSLTSTGWEQMWQATDVGMPWKGVVTSPLRRCAQFAYSFAQRHAVPVRADERLRELNFGRWEGRTAVELMETEPETLTCFWRDPWNQRPPEGEPFKDMQARVLAAWHDIVLDQRPVLVVSHGGPLRVILCHVSSRPVEDFFEIEVPHAALHRVEMQAPTCNALN